MRKFAGLIRPARFESSEPEANPLDWRPRSFAYQALHSLWAAPRASRYLSENMSHECTSHFCDRVRASDQRRAVRRRNDPVIAKQATFTDGGTSCVGRNRVDMRGPPTFMPHGMCFLWQPDILSLHAISDALIGLAYLAIAAALASFARNRADLPFKNIFWMFALFIVSFRCVRPHAASCRVNRAPLGDNALCGPNWAVARCRITFAALTSAWFS
jgi:hypothetical protein